jgi:FixJ family two-component response regulator
MSDGVVMMVDDDVAVRDSTALLLSLKGFATRQFASAEQLLAATGDPFDRSLTGCLLLDVRMTGMDGLALQAELARRGCTLPVVVITAHGDVDTARAALKGGALDFLEKPVDEDVLLTTVRSAMAAAAQRPPASPQGLARLTDREREVLSLVAQGRHNRDIGAELGISPRTVEVYRARLMEKLQARSVADLVRIALEHGPTRT